MKLETAALIVSICALVFTAYQAWLQRDHNRLSVRPHLSKSYHKTKRDDGIVFTFSLQNTGIGPAVIQSRKLFFDGKEFDCAVPDPRETFIMTRFPKEIYFQLLRSGFPGINTALIPGEEMCLAEIFFPGAKAEDLRKIQTLLERADYRLEYQSLYCNRFTLDTRGDRRNDPIVISG